MINLSLPCKNFLNESILGYSLGILFSYWSYGFIYYLLWIFGYEILYIFYLMYCDNYVFPLCRSVIFFSSIFGWITGRKINKISIF